MIRTIEELRALASQIEEENKKGQNTQLRVGGLFMDIIDFIGQIPVTETILGPLLQALNNSELINPGDGQTLTFSIIGDHWTFSDAITQLQLRVDGISAIVASNYEVFLSVKDQIQAQLDDIDQRVRSYKAGYDNDQLAYATWKEQTDTYIAQYAVAIDKNTGNIASISGRVDTAFDQIDFVTNNLDAADKALEKLFNLTGLDYEDPEESYTASWLYKNRQGIYGAAATFDENGKILNSSTLSLTIKGFEARVSNAEEQVSLISQTVDSIQLVVAGSQEQIDAINGVINGSEGNPGILTRLGADETNIANNATIIHQTQADVSILNAKFNLDGSLKNTSGLVVTADGEDNSFSKLFAQSYDATGASTAISSLTVDLQGVHTTIGRDEEIIDNINNVINGTPGNPGLVEKIESASGTISGWTESVAWVDANRDRITSVMGYFDANGKLVSTSGLVTEGNFTTMFARAVQDDGIATEADISVAVKDFVTKDGVKTFISEATIGADQIRFNMTFNWLVTNAQGQNVFKLDNLGNLQIAGTLTENCKDINGVNVYASLQSTKANYVQIPSGSGPASKEIKWGGDGNEQTPGNTIIFWGSHASGNVVMRLPRRDRMRNILGIDENSHFAVELNILSNANYDAVYLGFNQGIEDYSEYPVWMNYDNYYIDPEDAYLQMAQGDFVKVLIVFNPPKFRAYVLTRHTTGNGYQSWD